MSLYPLKDPANPRRLTKHLLFRQHLRLLHTVEGNDPGHPGAGVGQGASLVKDNGVSLGNRFQEFAAFHGDVLPARLPHG